MLKYFCSLLLILGAAAFGVEIVRDGKPCADIVIPEKAPNATKRAAEDLRDFLRKISGGTLEISTVPSERLQNHLFVGESEFTKKLGYRLPAFKNSGYDILVKDDYAVLCGPETIYPPLKYTKANLGEFQKFMGEKYALDLFENGGMNYNQKLGIFVNDDSGPWHAVSAFLENLGVRFYAPYENGTVIPERKNVSVSPMRETKEAAYGRRNWCYYGAMSSDAEGISWLKRLRNGVRNGIVYNHTTRDIIASPDIPEKHPEWLAEETPGKRFPGTLGQAGVPRFTDPGFRKACAEWAGKLFDTYPNLYAVTLGAPDGGNPYDWRDRKKYEEGGISSSQAYANMMWDFHCAVAAELKKTHPEKKLIWWCQYNENIPTNLVSGKIPDNLIFPAGGAGSSLVLDAIYNSKLKSLEKTRTVFHPSGKAPSWEYFLDYRAPEMPRYPVFWAKRLQEWRKAGVNQLDGAFIELQPQGLATGDWKDKNAFRIGCVPIVHLMVYLNSRLFWDPDLDLDSVLNEYYRLWFGPAEKEMKAFHEFASGVWNRQESRSVTERSGFLKEGDVEEYFHLLEKAKARTSPGTLYYDRIDAMEREYAPLKKLFAGLKRTGPWIRAGRVENNFSPDGDLSKYQYYWINLKENDTGLDVSRNRTETAVAQTLDGKKLFVAIRCFESNMAKLVSQTHANDDPSIYRDDLVEVYLDSPEAGFFKIAVNPEGAVYDESQDLTVIRRDTLPILWSPGVRAVVKKHPDRWEVEIMIPLDDFGKLGPTKDYPWGINICRTRISSLGFAGQKAYSVAPTGGAYRILSRWGRLWVRK